jgi:hypothetical protein
MSIYTEEGYKSRKDYLNILAEDMGIDKSMVYAAADMLGPNEDFDGLVTTLEDSGMDCLGHEYLSD